MVMFESGLALGEGADGQSIVIGQAGNFSRDRLAIQAR
jgi:hypothetical protein